nr:MAG TPA_asm: hypothetical protein [Caudoviricetes sp.]
MRHSEFRETNPGTGFCQCLITMAQDLCNVNLP